MLEPGNYRMRSVLATLVTAAEWGGLPGWTPAAPVTELADPAHSLGSRGWIAVILAIEIDLQVDIPDELAMGEGLTGIEFAQFVASLPRVTDPQWTLNRVAMILRAEGPSSSAEDVAPALPN